MGNNNPTEWSNYLDHIGLWFFFCGCAGVSIIVWVFNWVCWLNQCCCCDFLHNPVNKRIAWWMSFSFLLGVLACCISAFVTVNRFGFALEGAWCAIDRFYYDSFYGQLKDSNHRWKGLQYTKNIFDKMEVICEKINNKQSSLCSTININEKNEDKKTEKIKISLCQLTLFCSDEEMRNNINEVLGDKLEKIETYFLNDFDYYAKTLKACLKILAMIYYCLLLIATTAAGVSMMFYACLKRQGYLITFMHVIWNVIRFFIFSFFLYGTAYGIAFLSIRDSIVVIKYIFGDTNNSKKIQTKILTGVDDEGEKFLEHCLKGQTNLINDDIITSIKYIFDNNNKDLIGNDFKYIISCENDDYCQTFSDKEFDISFDCRFLRYDLNNLYRALSDASVESRILAALSLCLSFFGAVALYFFLLVMHHYNNELFFDSGKSIFTGFDGFGGGYKKKIHDKDPAYKKRKLRAEIELTSKNDEQSAYKNVNKNEEEY